MRGTGGKLEDRFIVPIARELAEALKAIHEAGIIHRDVKGNYKFTWPSKGLRCVPSNSKENKLTRCTRCLAANVMIHENGSLQVIDFGVAGVLQTKLDKRTTVIGTPHWMAPELHKAIGREGLNYGTEVSSVVLYACRFSRVSITILTFIG
jgi:serine/threonine protein kinase